MQISVSKLARWQEDPSVKAEVSALGTKEISPNLQQGILFLKKAYR